MLKIIFVLSILGGIYFPMSSLALPNPEFTFDMAKFETAKADLTKLKDLVSDVSSEYLDKYFEIYCVENKIDLVHSPLSYIKSRYRFRISQAKTVSELMPKSIASTKEQYKRFADEFALDFETSGRLLIAQKQTVFDKTLKELSEKMSNQLKSDEALVAKVNQFEEKMNIESGGGLKNNSLENRIGILNAKLKKYENMMLVLLGLNLVNVIFTFIFYRKTI